MLSLLSACWSMGWTDFGIETFLRHLGSIQVLVVTAREKAEEKARHQK
jgi:hypothetical protein